MKIEEDSGPVAHYGICLRVVNIKNWLVIDWKCTYMYIFNYCFEQFKNSYAAYSKIPTTLMNKTYQHIT